MSKEKEQYDEVEAQARFEAALRGARVAGHKPMTDIRRSGRRRLQKNRKENGSPASRTPARLHQKIND
jgi:hypothetical protein